VSDVARRQIAPGLDVSRVITGLWQVADQERDGRQLDLDVAARAMQPYVDAGFTTFDMADHYGSAEEIVGRFRGQGGGAVQALTKWVPSPGPVTESDAREAVDRARKRLSVERIDLLQFHPWHYANPSWLDAMMHLDALRREGAIGQIGLTNVDTAHLHLLRASGIPVVSNQVCYSLLDQRAARQLGPYAAANGVAVLAFGTLAGGFLSDRWLGKPEPDWAALQTWSQMKYGRFIRVAGGWEKFQSLLRTCRSIADRHDASIAAVATRAILDAPGVEAVIVGARLGERSHLDDARRALALTLRDDDRAALTAACDALDPIPGDCGDEYRRPPFLTASGDLSHHVTEMPAPYPVETDANGRRRAFSGTSWEGLAGYCRAVRVGDRILVSGTTATHGDRLVGGNDAGAQTTFALDKVIGAVESLGGSEADIVRTRIFVRRADDWEAVARAHGARMADVKPANTLVEARLIGDEYMVEVEAEAVVSASATS
jgi:aryl-alcohol dehydrogenase-like predicted oxidoreductase/enamine deaminase RidA (YjgF/YER057c/UK114 family)